MNEHKVTVYTSSICPVCQLVKDFFHMQHIPFEEINLDLRPVERVKLIAQSKQMRIPVTKINGQWIGGFHPENFFQALHDGSQ